MVYSRDRELVKDCIHDLIFDLYKYRKNLAENDNIRNYLFKSLKRKVLASGKKNLRLVYSENLTQETGNEFVITSYSIHYTKLYDMAYDQLASD